MQRSKAVRDLVPGDFVVRAGKTEVNGTFQERRPVTAGTRLVGARGGRYEATRTAETTRVLVVTSAGTPMLAPTATVLVEIPEEW